MDWLSVMKALTLTLVIMTVWFAWTRSSLSAERADPVPKPNYRIDKVGEIYSALRFKRGEWWIIDKDLSYGIRTRQFAECSELLKGRYICSTEDEAGHRINMFEKKYTAKIVWEG